MLKKPTIFLSHSSKDKEYISEIKRLIHDKTSGVIEIFQSSDGESIPFGNNWIHKIEEGLNNASIMFVFASPRSLLSSWIYFESGFSYSKKIRVIPVGISGVDIGTLPPPISLLQGFNVNSKDALGNLISIINEEFSTSFGEEFTDAEYSKLEQLQKEVISFNMNNVYIDKIKVMLSPSLTTDLQEENTRTLNAFEEIEEFFRKNDISHRVGGDQHNIRQIAGHGLDIRELSGYLLITISASAIKLYESFINFLPSLYKKPLETGWVHLYAGKGRSIKTDDVTTSALFYNHGLELSDKKSSYGFYKLGQFNIKTSPKSRHTDNQDIVIANFERGRFKAEDLYGVIEVLIKTGVVY